MAHQTLPIRHQTFSPADCYDTGFTDVTPAPGYNPECEIVKERPMPVEITMPRLSDTMEEGTLVKWHVSEGDSVSAGDHLADVETDKATMELNAFDDGMVAKRPIWEGDTVPVGQLILVLAEKGEAADDAAAKAKEDGSGQSEAPGSGGGGHSAGKGKDEGGEATKGEASPGASEASTAAPSGSAEGGGTERLRVSPVAKKMAQEHGLDLAQLHGSGPSGRIIKADVQRAIEQGIAAASSGAASTGEVGLAGAPTPTSAASQPPAPEQLAATGIEAKSLKVSNMRKTIAKRLVQSKNAIPHFTVSLNIDMDPLIDLRKTLNAQLESQGIKLSVGDFITRAAALACLQHPTVNSSWQESTIEQHGTVNVGVAVALPEERGGGLIVPVLRDVQQRGLRWISQETKRLAKKARDQGLSQEEMEGGTFTISNLGMFGVDHFEAIINPPQAAILAVGASNEKPVVKAGQIVLGHEMTATLSGDHRVVDGAIGAAYLQTLKQMLENPAGLLV
jgi:pyruvate dehydrogenase E2 component (dihydrolipoamide acetyltransferase)